MVRNGRNVQIGQMMNDRVSISVARETLAELIGRVQYGGEHIVLERRGKAVAALVSAEDAAFLDRLEDLELARMVAEVYDDPDYDPNDTVPAEEVFKRLLADETLK